MLCSPAAVECPKTLAEALQLRAAKPQACLMAGGTDVMVLIERDVIKPTEVINLLSIEDRGVRAIECNENELCIGALATHSQIWHNAQVVKNAGILAEACASIGARQIQNRGTIGGNIANASPAGDSLPVLLALDAEIELQSVRGARRVPMSALYTGYRRMCTEPDELITRIFIPIKKDENVNEFSWFRKIGPRRALAISKVMIAARLQVENGIVKDARIALGSVAATPVRAPKTEAALIGHAIDPSATLKLSEDIHPIDDLRSTADYRMTVATKTLSTWLSSLCG